ncbi:serine/threonine-protein kinase [Streptomyces coeruleorubidus]|uniref:non-specific serine/threonine protein kinase n=1 Tax=Streptomyces coeruleorubidus TaxID=116188 RepID=A0A5J6I8S2_STRC4|nr:serine/threonine-protein kinase [Streptomyces coeruleorubidus]QEV27311.1 serine/threonine protein kinase [Streptomyces coeruleorubidus]GGT67514.1 serine/threonine protein kinase [Streptomyces coeruleorubidus]
MSEAERAGTSRQDTRQDNRERLLAGRYRLGEVLGRGGMGTVWRAEDETLGRTVAVKELRFPSNIDEEEKRRLITRTLREAKAIARIRNNSAVTVFDVVQEDDRPWIVMELVEGKSLAEVIREDGLLEPKRAAEVGLAVLDVLRSAHREGILHRDVKPSNVLIAEDGRVVLTDFGIAQVEGDPSITSTGMLVGAPSYISPERARGHKPGPAADLWSLGGLLYAAVEGAPPYDKGSAIATLTAVMTEQLEEPKNAGPLRDVIHGLLTKDPAKRLDDAGARAMLNSVIHAPEKTEPEPLDATKVVPLPAQPDKSSRKGSSAGAGGKRGEEPAERLRGALRSVRKAAAGTAGASAASRTESADATASSGPESGKAGAGGAGASASKPGSASAAPGAVAGAGERGAQGEKAASGGRSSGWPVMTPPDLPPRPAPPRAPLTDVVPRRTLVIIAVVVALAVIGTVLAIALSGDDKDPKGAAGESGGKTVATASGSADTKGDESDGTRTDSGATQPAPSKSASNSPSGDQAGGSSGGGKGTAAESTHQGSQGYSIGLPKGWKYQSTGAAGDRFTGPDGQKLLIAWTSTPKGDPVADWKSQERFMQRAQYKKIRIEQVDYRGWNTADWEFTYVESGTKYRTIDRGFVVDDRQGYALMYTAKATDWSGELRKETWRTLTKTFEPKS